MPQNVIRVALSGYNALTDTDPKHYSLFSDQDNILIKEHSRGSATKNNGETATINHALGYNPHHYAYGEVSSGRYRLCNGYNIYGGQWNTWVDTNNLYLRNAVGSNNLTVKYFIFYDNIN